VPLILAGGMKLPEKTEVKFDGAKPAKTTAKKKPTTVAAPCPLLTSSQLAVPAPLMRGVFFSARDPTHRRTREAGTHVLSDHPEPPHDLRTTRAMNSW